MILNLTVHITLTVILENVLRIRFADLLFSFVFGEAVISTRWNLITVYNCNYVNQVISACLMFKKPKEIVDDLVSVIHSKCGHSC